MLCVRDDVCAGDAHQQVLGHQRLLVSSVDTYVYKSQQNGVIQCGYPLGGRDRLRQWKSTRAVVSVILMFMHFDTVGIRTL